ncbi:MAG: hypothetical protein KAV87_08750 [Desulfobacteraceae bacterium]|nr:hypothetical protein [Desulfobacteraceae bacterium]
MKMINRDMLQTIGILLIVAIFAAVPAVAGTAVSAKYLQPRGNHIRWQIIIPLPAPSAVLITQQILPGSEIIESSHPITNYDQKKGVAKWLLSSVPSGILEMVMKISPPILKKGEIHGEVLFKDVSSNTTASILMKPSMVKKALEGC